MAVVLAIGTRKGMWLATSTDRVTWEITGPHHPMTEVYALGFDTRQPAPRLLAGVTSEHYGPSVAVSDDLGATWREPDHAPIAFPADTGEALARVWQFAPGPAAEPDVVYAGVEPSAVFRSADGGGSWRASNQGIKVRHLPDPYPEFGQCVHKIAQHPDRPERFFLQNHHGVYRGDDLPADFGFPMVAHPHRPDVIYTFPLVADAMRFAPEAGVPCTAARTPARRGRR